MLNFNRNERTGDPKAADKNALRPSMTLSPQPGSGSAFGRYAPSGGAGPAAAAPPASPPAGPAHASATQAEPSASSATATPVAATGTGGSKLIVGRNVKLKGVEISDCELVVVEGQVEASVASKGMQIAKPGALKGTATIDVAEIDGDFTGELTVRQKLVINGTGRVSGTIRYGSLIVAEGGEVTGDVRRIDDAGAPTLTAQADARTTGVRERAN